MSVEMLLGESEVLDSVSEESQVFKCEHCGISFVKSKSLLKHIRKSHFRNVDKDDGTLLKSKEPNECKYCDRTFRKERNLTLHIRDDHDDEDLNDKSVKFDIEIEQVIKPSNVCAECGIDYHIESELKRHMALRHSKITMEDTNVDDEKLLAQDESETESLGGVFDVDSSEFELDGESVSVEDIDFDFNVALASDPDVPVVCVGNAEEQNNLENGVQINYHFEDGSVEEINNVEVIDNGVSLEQTENSKMAGNEILETTKLTENNKESSVEVELTADNILADSSTDFQLDGESIMMDDDAFDLLESAMQMTMTTPDESEEEDIPLSKRKSKMSMKKGRPSKKVKNDPEILLDGEAVVEDLEAADGVDILIVYDDQSKENNDNPISEEESGDDDPDFTPSASSTKRRVPLRKSTRTISKKTRTEMKSKTNATNKSVAGSNSSVQMTPVVKEKFVGRTRISLVQAGISQPVINSIPRSTKIVFRNENDERIDIRTSSNEKSQVQKKLLCSLCKKMYKSREEFNNHMVVDHKKLVKSETLSLKKNDNTVIDLQECDKCDASFPRKTMLGDHIKKAHYNKCVKCRQNFDSEVSLKQHMQTHLIKCDKCSYTGDTKIKVLEHNKIQHNFRCSKCKQAFDFKDKLDAHIRSNHFCKCGKCNVVFDVRSLLEEHNKKVHYFPCPFCDKVFDMKQRLMTHDKTSHQSCNECEDEFSWAEPGHTCYYTRNNVRPTCK